MELMEVLGCVSEVVGLRAPAAQVPEPAVAPTLGPETTAAPPEPKSPREEAWAKA